jgi:CubicO group peptidase (beta-lactamase class C family)
LGLTATATELLDEACALRATGHRRGRPVPAWQFDALTGAGGLHSTGIDLLAYLQAHLHPESTALADALSATHIPRAVTPTGKNAICLVWNHRVVDSRTLLWHTGGFSAFLGFSRRSQAVSASAASRPRHPRKWCRVPRLLIHGSGQSRKKSRGILVPVTGRSNT